MKLLLHTCCADCLIKMLASLKNEKENYEVVGYFCNSNIHPRSEYLTRLMAAQKIAEENKIRLVVADWSPKEWFKVIENKNNRCSKCWKLRLNKTFDYAKKNNFGAVLTTLLSSHYQDKDVIERVGKDLEKKYEIKFLIPNKIERDLETSGFYKQNYCGCCYSLVEAWSGKFK